MSGNCYCITLRKTTRRVTAIYDEALAPAGVNLAQFSLLRQIERHGPISLTDLARLAELDRSTVGRNVKVLERMQLAKAAEASDHREALVELAEQGTEVLRRAVPLWDDIQLRLEQKLGVDADKLTALLNAL